MIGFGIAAIIAAFLLFQAAFNSWRLALVATVALPLSLTGGLLTGLIGGRTFGLGALLDACTSRPGSSLHSTDADHNPGTRR